MKFKKYLIEASYDRDSAEMMALARIPITSAVAEGLGYDKRYKDVYHCSTTEFIDNMVKLQKTKNHISTFTHGLSNLLNSISVKPELMFVLNGRSVMAFEHDIFSHQIKMVEDG